MTRPLSPGEKRNKIEYFIKTKRETGSYPTRDRALTEKNYKSIIKHARAASRRTSNTGSQQVINLSGGRKRRTRRTIKHTRKTKRRHSRR